MKPATNHTIEDLEAKVEELVEELSGVESQLQDADQARRAEVRAT